MPIGRLVPTSRFEPALALALALALAFAFAVALLSCFFRVVALAELGGLRVFALSLANEASRLASASDVSVDNVCLTSSGVVEREMICLLALEEEDSEVADPDAGGNGCLFATSSSRFDAGPFISLISSTVFEPD